ncbi:DUF6895 family protein [Collimonas silvisoli]|uniref:DUF6895 family protein n=1 Tax=Collimonas silvisoli TaxID=2825884 RepID=UPI001B8B5725|nr:hypothetical protein [Collimonas silvisoli]
MQNRGIGAVTRQGASALFLNDAQRAIFTSGVLRWLETNIEQFRPPHQHAIETVAPESIVPGPIRKAFGELGAALRIVIRTPALRDRPEVRALVAKWLSMADEQGVFVDVEGRTGLFATHVALSVAMGDLRPPACTKLRERLQQVLSRGYVDRIERNAWQKLDLRYYFDAAGLAHRLPTAPVLLRASSLAMRPELPYVRDIDLYAVTHILFDLCDFGSSDPSPLLGKLRPDVEEYVQLALSMCIAEQNWDLSAELLMCRLYLGFDGELERWAMNRICAVQHESGYVPASTAAQDKPDARAPGDFLEAYHPTVVSLFLLAAEARTLQ